MSVLVSGLVWKHADVSQSTFIVLLAMADIANDDGSEIWPSMAFLAQKARMSERQLRRCMRELEGLRFIEMIEEASGRPGRFNSYRIDLNAIVASNPVGFGGRAGPDRKGNKDGGQNVPRDLSTGQIVRFHRTSEAGPPDKSVAHIDNRPISILETSFERASAARLGAGALAWERVKRSRFWPLLERRLGSGKPVPQLEGGNLVVEFDRGHDFAEALAIRRDVEALAGLPLIFRHQAAEEARK